MFRQITPVSVLSLMRKALAFGVTAYAGVATILLLRLRPDPILIGIDPYGTRVIRDGGDRLLRKEKEAFLLHTLDLLYTYDQTTFEKRVSQAGDLMSERLWGEKKTELSQIGEHLKTEELTQTAEVQELREVDAENFEADLLIHVKRRLAATTVKLRVALRLHARPRRENNPYPYEVEELDESQGN